MPFILSIGAWLGLTSLFVSGCFFFLDGIPSWFLAIDLFLLAAILFLFFRSFKGREPPQKASRVLTLSFYALLMLNITAFLFQSIREPHGGWDGWGIWNMHARFLFRGGMHWADFLTPLIDWTNPDYPWLVPATVARFWIYLGREVTLIPALIAFFFTFGTVGLLYFSLKKIAGKNQALMAGIVLLGIPFFFETGGSQMADAPMAFYILAVFCLLTCHDISPVQNRLLPLLAGLCGGFGAWTKNEGVLFLAAFTLVQMAVRIRSQAKKRGIRELGLFGLGLLPSLALLFYFKAELAPPSRLFGDPGTLLERLSDFSRYLEIAGAFYRQLGDRIWNWFPVFLIFYPLVTGIRMEERFKRPAAAFLGTIFLMLGGYFFIYLIAPFDLTVYLETSLNRLLAQLWPAFLFNYFLLVPVPSFHQSSNPMRLSIM